MRPLSWLAASLWALASFGCLPNTDVCDSVVNQGNGDSQIPDSGGEGSGSGAGLDLSPRITRCPAWAGVPDTLAAGSTYQAKNAQTGSMSIEHTLKWLDLDGGPPVDATTSGVEVSSGSTMYAQSSDVVGETFTRQRAFYCDEEGLWLQSDTRNYTATYANGTVLGELRISDSLQCTESPLRLIPNDLALGSTWQASCRGDVQLQNGFDPIDCTYDFSVTEQAELTTPAGSWEAAHVVISASSGGNCAGTLQVVSWFGAPQGFWIGRGIGVIAASGYLEGDVLLAEAY